MNDPDVSGVTDRRLGIDLAFEARNGKRGADEGMPDTIRKAGVELRWAEATTLREAPTTTIGSDRTFSRMERGAT